MARVNQNLRQRYLRKSKKIARKEYKPVRQRLRKDLKRVKRSERQAIHAADAGAAMFADIINGAQASLKNSGLKGKYRAQVAGELAMRAADVAASVPYQKSMVRQDFAPDRVAAREAIADNRIGQTQTAQDVFQQLIQDRLEAGPSQDDLQDRRQNQRDRKQELATALRQAEVIHGLEQGTKEGQKGLANQPEEYWLYLENQVAKSEGVDPLTARRAVAMYRQQQTQQGTDFLRSGVGETLGLASTILPSPLSGPMGALGDLINPLDPRRRR